MKDLRKADLFPHFKQRYKHSDLLQRANLDTSGSEGPTLKYADMGCRIILEETLSTRILILPFAFF